MSLRDRVLKEIDFSFLVKIFSIYQLSTVFNINKNVILSIILEKEKIKSQKIEIVDELEMQTNGEWSELKKTELYRKLMS